MSHHPPTPEQLAIFSAALTSRSNLMISAYAGCGKSTTLEMLSHKLPEEPTIALAFNVKIAKELKERLPSYFEVKTFNGLGHSAWGRALGKRCELEERKLSKLLSTLCKEEELSLEQDEFIEILNLVKRARHAGLVPSSFTQRGLLADITPNWDDLSELTLEEHHLALARELLVRSIKKSFEGLIDYDDQVYMSSLFGGQFPRFSRVFVDEAQDLSPLNHRQIAKVAGLNGRLFVVGDPKQAIYGFRGADHTSMDSLRGLRKDWTDLLLSLTFRCPRAIVDRQQNHAPGYTAAPANADGEVLPWAYDLDDQSWTWSDVREVAGEDHIAILCRNTAPVIKMAFKLIRQGIGCHVLGRDIGKGLTALVKKEFASIQGAANLITAITSWKERQRALAEANEKDEKVAKICDQAESLIAVCEVQEPQSGLELARQLDDLFSRSGGVALATIHRAKGLEWPVVVHLDPWRVPSKYAQKDEAQMQQELNLKYVAETRAQRALILANLQDFQEVARSEAAQ